MGEAFIVRRGGSGLSANGAVLRITAETGSTITLSKNDVIVATLPSGKGHTNAENANYADWYYPVSASNYGSWTVSAAKSGKTASKTVTVDSNKQYDVLLTYELYIIKNGYIQSPFTLKLDYGKFQVYTNIENYNALGYLYTLKAGQYGRCGFCTEQTVNVDNYSSLKIDVAFDWDRNTDTGYANGIGLASSKNSITASDWPYEYTSVQAAYYLFPDHPGTDRRTCTKDISSLTGNFYITAYEGAHAYQGTRIYNFWLE